MAINYEVYSLNDIELAILLASKGIDKIYGFPLTNKTIDSDDQMIQLLHRMVNRKVLTSDGEAFSLLEPYDKIISILKSAKDAIILTPSTEELPMRCCYISDKILVSERSMIQKDTIKFCLLENNELFEFLDEGYLPVQLDKEIDWINPNMNETGYMDQALENMKKGIKMENEESVNRNIKQNNQLSEEQKELTKLISMETSDLLKIEQVHLVIDKLSTQSGDYMERLLILEKPLCYQIIASNYHDYISLVYSVTNMKSQLEKLLREGEI